MMKKIFVFYLLVFSVLYINGQSQSIFSYGTNGNIVTNASYIKPLDAGKDFRDPVTPYLPVGSFSVMTSGSQNYTIDLYRYQGWDGEAGDMNVIEIKNNTSTLLQLREFTSWTRLFGAASDKNKSNDYFIPVNLGLNTMAFIFIGCPYGNVGYLSIVLATPNEAKLIFNQHLLISSMTNNDSTFSMIVQDDIVEYRNGVACGSPNSFRIYKDGGILKIENQ